MEEKRPHDDSITLEILKEYIPRIVKTSTFRQRDYDDVYIKTQFTLDDLFIAAGETQKPVGIYVNGRPELDEFSIGHMEVVNFMLELGLIDSEESFFMIFDPTNLSVELYYIYGLYNRPLNFNYNYDRENNLNETPRYFNSKYYLESFNTIEKARSYMMEKLYYENGEERYYLIDPMAKLYAAEQIFFDYQYRPYLSSYIETPISTATSNFYYSMILILLGKQSTNRLKSKYSNNDLGKYLMNDRQTVLDMIRVEKATVASLTLSRYLEERELAKRIGEMTMNL